MRRRAVQSYKPESQPQDFEQKEDRVKDYISLKAFPQGKSKSNFQDLHLLQIISQQNYRTFCETKSKIKQKEIWKQSQQYKELNTYIKLKKNVCVMGAGSKIKLLKEFKRNELQDRHIWQVKGYLPTVNIRKIYNHFGQFLVKAGVKPKIVKIHVKDQLQEYRAALEESNVEIAVVFHSIDGPNLLSADAQKSLSCLFSLPNIQLICSLDNMKIVICWSPITVEKYKFIFFKVDTLVDYHVQQRSRPQDIEKKEKSENALVYIWQSLNNNQKQILKIIAKNQLQNLNRTEACNYTAGELFDICVDEIILSQDSQLRQNLLQMLDHKVITQNFDQKRNKKVYEIKYDKKLLQRIVLGTLSQ